MKNKIFYITIFLLFLGGLFLWNRTKSRQIETDQTTIIDIDRFVDNGLAATLDATDTTTYDHLIDFRQLDYNTSIWTHKEALDTINQNTNSISINLIKKGSNYYYQTIIKYVGEEEIGLKNIYITSNLKPKAKILEVSNDNYTIETNHLDYIESVVIETKASDKIFIHDYLDGDTINIVFMGFKKNVPWVLSDKQLQVLKESYSYYNKLIN